MIKRSISITLSIIIVALTLFSTLIVPANAATEVKGKTIAQVLGMDGGVYMEWLQSHENDSYYLGTPYGEGDYRNPNGDCKGAYGNLDTKGVAAMNCTGFVWHVLMKATKSSGGTTSIIPAMSGWVTFYRNNNISRKYFSSKAEMLESGYLEKGDIIWMFQNGSEATISAYNHVGIYWGDGSSDVFWHSLNGGSNLQGNVRSKIVPKQNNNVLYVAIKGGVKQRSYFKVVKSSSNTNLTGGNSNYTFNGIRYSVSKSRTDFDANGSNYIGYITLNAKGEGYSKDGSRATLRKLSPGTYYMKETYLPANCGYEKDESVYTVKVTVNHTITNPLIIKVTDTPKTCYGKIVKASTKPELTNGNPDYSMEGIRYSFSKSKTDFSSSGTNYIGYVLLDENGVGYTENGSRATLRNLVPGTYYVKETVIPAGCKYKMDNTVYTMTFTFDNDKNHLKVLNVKDEPEGTISAKVIKKSLWPEFTDGNPLYSFEGAEFTFYRTLSDAEQETNAFTTLTTDENGVALVSDIELGTFYVKETQAPENFERSDEIKELVIDTVQDEAYEVEFEDKPLVANLSVLLQKINADTGETGQRDMSGAEYTVCYYADFIDEEQVGEATPTRTWVLFTDEDNLCKYDSDHYAYGDVLYQDGDGNYVIPFGTLTIQETKAPRDFYLDETVYYRLITKTNAEEITQYNLPISPEYEIPYISLSGEKTWDDNNNRDGKRPASITVELYRDDEMIDSATVSAATDWKYEFTDLPKGYADLYFDDHFYYYTYEVKEDAVQYYESESSGLDTDPDDSDHLICDFVNHYTPEKITVNGTKTWSDYDDLMGRRPSSITIILYRDNVEYKTKSVSAADNWQYEFTDLYRYHDGGQEYVYTVGERNVTGYTMNVDGTDLTNTMKTGRLTILKTDPDGDPVPGVEFLVYSLDVQNNGVVSLNDSGVYHFSGFTDVSGGYRAYTSDDNGRIVIDGLPYGIYQILEVHTEGGYMPYYEPIYVTLDSNQSSVEATVNVENAKAILPETGGIGSSAFYILTLLLLGAEIMLLRKVTKKIKI